MQKIEDDKDLSPRTKRALKEKARIEELCRKIDIEIKHKQVKDKITPRNYFSGMFSFSQGSMGPSVYNSVENSV